MKEKKDRIGNRSQYLWDKAACIAELNSVSHNSKSNYSGLAKKFNLLNNKGIYDLQCKSYVYSSFAYSGILYRGNNLSFTQAKAGKGLRGKLFKLMNFFLVSDKVVFCLAMK